jgi:hypothetical protein
MRGPAPAGSGYPPAIRCPAARFCRETRAIANDDQARRRFAFIIRPASGLIRHAVARQRRSAN